MGNDNSKKTFSWKGMPEKAQQILGEDFFSEINKMLPRNGPPIDIYKTEDKVIVTIELPGLSAPDRIAVRVKGLRLVVSGEMPWTYPVPEQEMLQQERFYGSFKREIALPDDITPDEPIEAKYKAGLLEISIQRHASEDERQIPIDFRD